MAITRDSGASLMPQNLLEVDLKEYLSAQPAITALVPPSQIYPAFIRSDASWPAISICTVGRTITRTLDYTRIQSKRIQIDTFAVTYQTCKQLEVAVLAALDGFEGLLQSGSTIRVISCLADLLSDQWDENSGVFRTMQAFVIDHTATT
jgi:hypothetical protein